MAIREGDWKLVAGIDRPELKPGAGITEEDLASNRNAEPTGFSLFNLRTDLAETTDWKESETARFNGMKERLLKKYHEVRDESPEWPLWEFPRYEALRIEWPAYQALRKPPVHVP